MKNYKQFKRKYTRRIIPEQHMLDNNGQKLINPKILSNSQKYGNRVALVSFKERIYDDKVNSNNKIVRMKKHNKKKKQFNLSNQYNKKVKINKYNNTNINNKKNMHNNEKDIEDENSEKDTKNIKSRKDKIKGILNRIFIRQGIKASEKKFYTSEKKKNEQKSNTVPENPEGMLRIILYKTLLVTFSMICACIALSHGIYNYGRSVGFYNKQFIPLSIHTMITMIIIASLIYILNVVRVREICIICCICCICFCWIIISVLITLLYVDVIKPKPRREMREKNNTFAKLTHKLNSVEKTLNYTGFYIICVLIVIILLINITVLVYMYCSHLGKPLHAIFLSDPSEHRYLLQGGHEKHGEHSVERGMGVEPESPTKYGSGDIGSIGQLRHFNEEPPGYGDGRGLSENISSGIYLNWRNYARDDFTYGGEEFSNQEYESDESSYELEQTRTKSSKLEQNLKTRTKSSKLEKKFQRQSKR